jgi:hypothetical protein
MIFSVLIGIFFIPTLYAVFEKLRELPIRWSGRNPRSEFAAESVSELELMDEMDEKAQAERRRRAREEMEKRRQEENE